MAERFNSIKINSGEKNGSKIADQYNVVGVPHVIFTDAEGSEIDRLIGYSPPEEYIPMVKDILNGVNTLPALEKEYTEKSDDIDVWVKLAKKYSKMGRSDDAKNLYNQLIAANPENRAEELETAHFYLAKYDWEQNDISSLTKFIAQFSSSTHITSAWRLIARYHSAQEDTSAEVEAMQKMAESDPENPGTLNSYAWRMTELKLNLEDALIKARKGVELSDDDGKPMILDTEAEVLWLMGKPQEAIDVINRAIEMDPEDDYYKEQLEKFTETLQES